MAFIASGGRRAKFQEERTVVRKLDPMVTLLAGVWSAIADQKVVDFPPVMHDFADVFPDELLGPQPYPLSPCLGSGVHH